MSKETIYQAYADAGLPRPRLRKAGRLKSGASMANGPGFYIYEAGREGQFVEEDSTVEFMILEAVSRARREVQT